MTASEAEEARIQMRSEMDAIMEGEREEMKSELKVLMAAERDIVAVIEQDSNEIEGTSLAGGARSIIKDDTGVKGDTGVKDAVEVELVREREEEVKLRLRSFKAQVHVPLDS